MLFYNKLNRVSNWFLWLIIDVICLFFRSNSKPSKNRPEKNLFKSWRAILRKPTYTYIDRLFTGVAASLKKLLVL
jgi:hypothetical protein